MFSIELDLYPEYICEHRAKSCPKMCQPSIKYK